MEDPQTLEEIEAEILSILEDCQRQGLTKAQIREVFSPLGLPEINKPDDDGVDPTVSRRKSPGQGSANWRRTLLYIAVVIAVGAFSVHFCDDQLKGIRFHALAVTRIALIKVSEH